MFRSFARARSLARSPEQAGAPSPIAADRGVAVVGELLRQRCFGLPFWQAADQPPTDANRFVIRWCPRITKRSKY